MVLQVIAMDPVSVDRFSMPQDMLDKEREHLMEQAKAMKPKNADVLSKIVEGKLEKFFETHCLVDQPFILEDKASVSKVLKQLSKEFPGTFRVSKFAVMKIGLPPRLASTH
jgi:elongation factor Ts